MTVEKVAPTLENGEGGLETPVNKSRGLFKRHDNL